MENRGDNVSIKIQTGIYNQFRYLQNKVWYVLSEYVDNAIQSFEDNKPKLKELHGEYFNLEINIDINRDKDIISIKDNAAGINIENYYRAFEPANIPVDNSGLHEYGMGMKTSSVWLSDIWTVRTKALEEKEERTIEFNLEKVIKEKKEVLNIIKVQKPPTEHYTEIVLKKLSKNAPTSRQISMIKKHLSSIYRIYIRNGELNLYVNGELLTYEDPKILKTSYHKTPNGPEILWKKEIYYKSGNYSVKGFIGILETMKRGNNGISLFRRGRVIVGSYDEKYTPKVICGQEGSPRYKRIFGELELDGFTVSFNKGSFVEEEDLQNLMEAIKIEISNKDFDLYDQAQNYIKPKDAAKNTEIAKKLVRSQKKKKENRGQLGKGKLNIRSKEEDESSSQRLKKVETIDSYEDRQLILGVEYILKQEYITDESILDLYTLEVNEDTVNRMNVVYKINLANNFFNKYQIFKKDKDYQPIVAIIKSLVLAELVASKQDTTNGGNIRTNFNDFLKDVS